MAVAGLERRWSLVHTTPAGFLSGHQAHLRLLQHRWALQKKAQKFCWIHRGEVAHWRRESRQAPGTASDFWDHHRCWRRWLLTYPKAELHFVGEAGAHFVGEVGAGLPLRPVWVEVEPEAPNVGAMAFGVSRDSVAAVFWALAAPKMAFGGDHARSGETTTTLVYQPNLHQSLRLPMSS